MTAGSSPLEVLDGVGDVHVVTAQANLGQRLVEDPAGRTDEGFPGLVLLVAGLLAQEQETGGGRAFPEDRLGGVAVQVAGLTAGGFACQPLQLGFGAGGAGGFHHHGGNTRIGDARKMGNLRP
jgi:hypothetical protein